MFKFLKEKLKEGIKSISKGIDEGGIAEEKIAEKPVEPEKKGFFAKLKERFGRKDEEDAEEKKADSVEDAGEVIEAGVVEGTVKIHDEAEEYQKKREIEREKKAFEKEVEAIKEKVKRKELPSIYELEKAREEKEKIERMEKEIEEPKEEIEVVAVKDIVEESPKRGFFQAIKEKITTKKIDNEKFEKIFWDLEMALLENNVAVEVIEKIKDDLRQEIVDRPLPRGRIEEGITNTLKGSIEQLLSVKPFDFLKRVREKKPFVICFVGINGSGKTTTIAKIARLLIDNKLAVVIAASDTFRAASIEQLQIHADRLGVKLIKHNYGADPAAVAFDAVRHADAKGIDAVLIDTAGRQHSNVNLVDEMKKIVKVAKPDLKVFIGESITGNDCVEQAKKFNEAIGIDAIILSKADVDEKGGAAISVSYVTQKPIIYIGTGQRHEDLKEFDKDMVIENLGLA